MKKNNIKMVVCDIDDTLVHKEVHLSQDIINTIQKLKEKGIYFTFATGRMPYRVEVFEKEADLQIPYVANNGSILYSNGKIIYSKMLKASLLRDSLRKFMQEDPEFTVIFSYEDRERPVRRTPWIEARLHKYKGYDETLGDTDDVWNQEVHKVYVLDDRLIDYMKLKKDEVMAIGDHTNDIEIVSMVGLGVAVGNATPKLKEVADYVAKGEVEAGVIEASNKFLFNVEV